MFAAVRDCLRVEQERGVVARATGLPTVPLRLMGCVEVFPKKSKRPNGSTRLDSKQHGTHTRLFQFPTHLKHFQAL